MDIIGEAKKALKSLAGSVSQQAEYLKLQTRLGNLEDDRERQFAEVGRRARELWKMRKVRDPELDVLMRRITELEEEMAALREEIIKHGEQAPPDSS